MPNVRIIDSFHLVDSFSLATISPISKTSIPERIFSLLSLMLSLMLSLTLFNDVGVEYIFFFIGGYGGKGFFFCVSRSVSRSVSSGNTNGFVFLKETLSETQKSD